MSQDPPSSEIPPNPKHLGLIFLGTSVYTIAGSIALVVLVLLLVRETGPIAPLAAGQAHRAAGAPNEPDAIEAAGRAPVMARRPFPVMPLVAFSVIVTLIALLVIGSLRYFWPRPTPRQATIQKSVLFSIAGIGLGLVVGVVHRPQVNAEHGWIMGLVLLSITAIVAPSFYVVSRLLMQLTGNVSGPEPQRFDPLDDDALPPPVLSYFDRGQPALEALGFRRIGQYSHKTKSSHFARYFHHDELGIFAALEWSRLFFVAIHNCSILTLFDDGTYLESGNGSSKNVREGRFQLRAYRGLQPERLFHRHLEETARLEEEHGCSAFRLPAQSLQSLSFYGLKLCYDDLVKRRIASSNPYADLDLMDLARQIAGEDAACPEEIGAPG